ncbi:hypothetical protein EYC84_009155 [Monilinia fructicola]|uniref:RRM domain-containing protein n=1 Tax=Monilinia fructicola TaxID=38448 RepID=A0A5M9JDC1_MONFR|nr:hypothetical protein EYC84_009155 [Monilinia fructicola]
MTSEAPEFHTKIQSPLSPLPVHIPNPSEIPVLRNQIDQTFNMTTTHEPSKPVLVVPETIESSPSDTRFSDAYDEKDEDTTEAKAEEEDGSDGYAMTFDSDGEEHSDSHDQSQAVDQKSNSLSNTVPTSELSTSLPNDRSATFDTQNGPETQPRPTTPSLTVASIPQPTAAQSSDDTQNPTIKTESTNSEDTNGDIDIQQLLDNITANAEINAQAARPNSSSSSNAPPKDLGDRPFRKKYDEFLDRERTYVTEGLWERFPKGSRLFIGNLPSEKLTKRDLFHVFHKYGELAQISIKQAFGFVQFHDAAACFKALEMEQGKEVRGRKMHLEVSKAQKNTRKEHTSGRSRNSQFESRGSNYNQNDRNHNDRYRSQQPHSTQRAHDGYRPGRSPSPSRGYRGRDEHRSTRNSASYDSRDRRRSRSPFSGAQRGGYRDRSPSPRTREANEDGTLQIPRREPSMVPDVQIILMAELDRGFVSWVEGELRGRGVKTEVMFLSPRLPLQAVVRRQILEGVIAVSQLDVRSQNASKIPLQVFDRSGGINAAVRFDEYQDLEPKIAAELVVRAKSLAQRPQYPPNSAPVYQAPASTAQPNPNIANIMGQLDNSTLQKLLGTLNNMPQQQNAPAVAANSAVDLVSLLGGLAPQQQAPQPMYQQSIPQAAADPYGSYKNNVAYGQPAAQQKRTGRAAGSGYHGSIG